MLQDICTQTNMFLLHYRCKVSLPEKQKKKGMKSTCLSLYNDHIRSDQYICFTDEELKLRVT